MSNKIPIETVITNEIKLTDHKGTKFSITFGDADINEGYSYGRINFRVTDSNLTMIVGQDRYMNFSAKDLKINDKSVWSEICQGPGTGMNADLLDGYHALDFKDTKGANHYKHMYNSGGSKQFVKIADLSLRRVGDAPNFNANGTPPYESVFKDNISKMEHNSLKERFSSKTKHECCGADFESKEWYYSSDGFHTTDMITKGIYNCAFRGNVTILKGSNSCTFDVHLGLFQDPTSNLTEGWSGVNKFFQVSLHENNLPFIQSGTEGSRVSTKAISKETQCALDVANAKVKALISTGSDGIKSVKKELEKIHEELLKETKGSVSIGSDESYTYYGKTNIPNPVEQHSRPLESTAGYVAPPDPTGDYTKPPAFPGASHPGDSYCQYLDVMRLVYKGSTLGAENIIDGVPVTVHHYELYVITDGKSEVHVQPYMSSGCNPSNFSKPVAEAQVTGAHVLKPKSIYDERYAHKDHRHYDLEAKIWELINQIDKIWDAFDNYVVINQGASNARKILMTDATGKVFAAKDNMERHQDSRRIGARVLVTNVGKCIAESEITINELAQLEDIDVNIKEQFDTIWIELSKLRKSIINIIEDIQEIRVDITDIEGDITIINEALKNFVKKSGDTMHGGLILGPAHESIGGIGNSSSYVSEGEPTVSLKQADGKAIKIYASANNGSTAFGVWDCYRSKLAFKYMRGANAGDESMQFDATIKALDNHLYLAGKKVTVSSSTPSGAKNGDVWIKSW